MNDQGWIKLLDLVCRELSARDAYVQIGGLAPQEPTRVHVPLEGERRLVAVFDTPPGQPDVVRERMQAVRDAFQPSGDKEASRPSGASRSELDHALADLASRARAESALVFDIDSPMVWGCSAVDGRDVDLVQLDETAEVDVAVRQAGLRWDTLLDRDIDATLQALRDGLPEEVATNAARVVELMHLLWVDHGRRAVDRRLRIARAVRAVSQQRGEEDPPTELTLRESELNLELREFATIYRLLLVFEDSFSPLHAEAAMQRAVGHIERLVLALPPIDPDGGRKAKGARVLRLV